MIESLHELLIGRRSFVSRNGCNNEGKIRRRRPPPITPSTRCDSKHLPDTLDESIARVLPSCYSVSLKFERVVFSRFT